MAEILDGQGIGWVEWPRLECGGEPISATRVRRALAAGDLASIRNLVPETTYDYLCSPEAGPIAARLRIMKEEA